MKKNKSGEEVPRRGNMKWVLKTFAFTFLTAAVFSLVSELISAGVSIVVSVLILLLLVSIGCIFDVVGTAAASADAAPFAAMSSKKIRGARESVALLKNVDKVTNICNDVIGDICGIVSGSASAAIVFTIVGGAADSAFEFWLGIAVSALVSAMTVGGKAFGKSIALRRSHDIIFLVGYFISLFKKQDSVKCLKK